MTEKVRIKRHAVRLNLVWLKMLKMSLLAGLLTLTCQHVWANCSEFQHRRGNQTYWRDAVAVIQVGQEKGTAFLIDRERGLFLTAYHVVRNTSQDDPVRGQFREGTEEPFELRLIGHDGDLDVALLEAKELQHLAEQPELELSFRLASEQSVVVLTAAYGRITRPEIKPIEISVFSVQDKKSFSLAQRMERGSSGAPVISQSHGLVVGIVTHSTTGTTQATRVTNLKDFFLNKVTLSQGLSNLARNPELVTEEKWKSVFGAQDRKRYRNYEIADLINKLNRSWKGDRPPMLPLVIEECNVFNVISNRHLDEFNPSIARIAFGGRESQDQIVQDVRFVPQPNLTELSPQFVTFHPSEANVIMVVNRDGRIDVLDIRDRNRPVKTLEIPTTARTAAFSPDGSQIVSGGLDGMLRLWEVNGGAVGESALKGDEGAILRVAFSPDGTRVISGGENGAVRLWDAGREGIRALGVHRQSQDHDGEVLSVIFTGDTGVISGGTDGTVRLWEAGEDGLATREVKRFAETGAVGVAFNSEGKLAVYNDGGKGTVQLWDVESGRALGEPVKANEDAVMFPRQVLATFSRDGRRLFTGGMYDGTVRLWAVNEDGLTAIDVQEGHEQRVTGVAFNPNGTRAVSSDLNSLRLWDTASGSPIGGPLEANDQDGGSQREVMSAAYSRDTQRIVSASGDGTVRYWSFHEETLRASRLNEGHLGVVTRVAFSPDQKRIVSGGFKGLLQLSHLGAGGTVTNSVPLKGHQGYITSVAFSHDGRLIASGDSEGILRLWDARNATAIGEPRKASEHHESTDFRTVSNVAFSQDGNLLVSTGSDGTLRLWNVENEGLQSRVPPQQSNVDWIGTGVAFSPDGNLVVFSDGRNGTLHFWDVDEWGAEDGSAMTGHQGAVHAVAFHPNGKRIVSGGRDGRVRLWDVPKRIPVGKPLKVDRDWVSSVAFSPDGTRIVTGGFDGAVRLWAVEGVNAIDVPLARQESSVSRVVLNPDGRLVVRKFKDRRRVELSDLDQWGNENMAPLVGPEHFVRRLITSEDGTRGVRVDMDAFVHYWNMEEWNPEYSEELHWPEHVWSVALSRDGRRIVLGRDNGTVQLWDLELGTKIGSPLATQDGPVRIVALSRDEKRIASGGDDGTVRIWDLEKRRPVGGALRIWDDPKFRVSGVAFNPDGSRLASGIFHGPVRIWDVSSGSFIVSRLTCSDYDLLWPDDNVLLVRCPDRLVYFNSNLDRTGQVFLLTDGLVAIADGKGVYASNSELKSRVLAFNRQNERVDLKSISIETLQQVLFDNWDTPLDEEEN